MVASLDIDTKLHFNFMEANTLLVFFSMKWMEVIVLACPSWLTLSFSTQLAWKRIYIYIYICNHFNFAYCIVCTICIGCICFKGQYPFARDCPTRFKLPFSSSFLNIYIINRILQTRNPKPKIVFKS